MELRFDLAPEQEREIAEELKVRGRATPEFEYGFFDKLDRPCVVVRSRVAIRPGDYRPGANDMVEQHK